VSDSTLYSLDYLQLSLQQAQEKHEVISGKVPALLLLPSFCSSAGAATPAPAPAGAVLVRLAVPPNGAGVVRRLPAPAAALGLSRGLGSLRRSLACVRPLLRRLGPGLVLQAAAPGSHVPLPEKEGRDEGFHHFPSRA